MKKIVVFLTSILVLSLFGGCSLFGLVDDVDSLTGVLSAQKSSDDYPGTHLLTDEEGEVYALNSGTLKLSNRQYIGNNVTVTGGYNDDGDIFVVTGVSVLEVLATDNVKANGTTYMNQNLGVKLKYYDDWEIEESDNSVCFLAPFQGVYDEEDEGILPANDIACIRDMIGDGGSAADYFADTGFTSVDSKIGADLQSAKKYTKTGSSEVHFIVDGHETSYDVSFLPNENFNDNNLRTFYEMILEFQFVPKTTEAEEVEAGEATPEAEAKAVEPEATASATAYDYSSFSEFESLPYHFTAKYPAGWYYSGSAGSEDGVLHKYAFSDESVTKENEFASLKVLSTDMPSGTSVSLPNGPAVKKYVGSQVFFYVEVGGRLFSVQGSKDHEDALSKITASITPVEDLE